MKYTKDQRLDIGRRIYEGEISRFEAATEFSFSSVQFLLTSAQWWQRFSG